VKTVSSEIGKLDKEKLKVIHERNKERGLIIKELKAKGPSTLEKLSEATGLEKEKLFQHVIALRQLGKISFMNKEGDQYLYGLSESEERA